MLECLAHALFSSFRFDPIFRIRFILLETCDCEDIALGALLTLSFD